MNGTELLRVWWELTRAQVVARLRRAPVPGLATDHALEQCLREVALPSSALVTQALTLVQSVSPPALTGHVLRTYAFGTLLGVRDGLQWDRETFALGALFHDIALGRRRHGYTCFAHDGADQAVDFMTTHEVPATRCETVAEAICLHLRVEVPPSLGVEAHLVRAGSGLDVVGARATELPPQVIGAVLRSHPRGDLVGVLREAFAAEVRQHPTARISRWMAVGFGGLVARNPLERWRG